MNPRSVIATSLVGVLVVSVLAIYTLQTSPSRTITVISQQTNTIIISTSYTSVVTVSGNISTTTVFPQVKIIAANGSQAVLCTATSIVVEDTVVAGPAITGTRTIINGNSTMIVVNGNTDIQSSVYASATNVTNSAGYVVTSTSINYGDIPSEGWTVMTCTYLP